MLFSHGAGIAGGEKFFANNIIFKFAMVCMLSSDLFLAVGLLTDPLGCSFRVHVASSGRDGCVRALARKGHEGGQSRAGVLRLLPGACIEFARMITRIGVVTAHSALCRRFWPPTCRDCIFLSWVRNDSLAGLLGCHVPFASDHLSLCWLCCFACFVDRQR